MKRTTAILLILVFLTPMTVNAGAGGGAEVDQNGVGHWNEGSGANDEFALDMGWIEDFFYSFGGFVAGYDWFRFLRK